ncbi:MAG: hypothetical protein JWN18_255 [Parcubacteria group bacterium]|nr:hypothetical protein [Parcubacteria group bacterium]
MRKLLSRAFVLWLPFVIAITGVFGFAYVAVQQNYRQSLNDPQIQMAEDAAISLAREYLPANILPRNTPPIDMRTSLATWITVYDASGTPLESSATLDGVPPRLPPGLFDTRTWTTLKTLAAPTGPETRVTWQPRPDVRQAVVLVQFKKPDGVGYVAVGRSMRITEDRVIDLTQNAALAWCVTVLATFVAIFLVLALGWL